MAKPLLELAIVLVLVVMNGVFALSELAIVSAPAAPPPGAGGRRQAGARAALALAEDPSRFLSTVQIGITLVGVLSGAFSGAALGGYVAVWLVGLGLTVAVAQPLGFGLVVALVTYFSIVVGQLVPQRLALRNPEGLACRVAPMMTIVSRVTSPVVWLLDVSGNLVLRLFDLGAEPDEERVTDDDLKALLAEAAPGDHRDDRAADDRRCPPAWRPPGEGRHDAARRAAGHPQAGEIGARRPRQRRRDRRARDTAQGRGPSWRGEA